MRGMAEADLGSGIETRRSADATLFRVCFFSHAGQWSLCKWIGDLLLIFTLLYICRDHFCLSKHMLMMKSSSPHPGPPQHPARFTVQHTGTQQSSPTSQHRGTCKGSDLTVFLLSFKGVFYQSSVMVEHWSLFFLHHVHVYTHLSHFRMNTLITPTKQL